MEVTGLLKENIEELWPVLEPYIARAIAEIRIPPETTEHVKERLLEGSLQAWVALDTENIYAVMTTYVSETPLHTRVTIEHLAGEGMNEWIGLYTFVESWAREVGADCIKIYGRPGWARVLREEGFVPDHIVLTKDLR